MTKGAHKTRIDYRSAKNGHYVTEGFAKKHPNTTVKETTRIGK